MNNKLLSHTALICSYLFNLAYTTLLHLHRVHSLELMDLISKRFIN